MSCKSLFLSLLMFGQNTCCIPKQYMDKKILITDDEPHIRALLEQTLEDFEDEGVEILTVKSLSEVTVNPELSLFCEITWKFLY